jgi:sterol desaturase/sphingolipid hydroxylase (fatty acid hydroxylase superfamily)
LAGTDALIRAAIFLGVLFVMGVWESGFPWRRLELGRWRRWPGNLGLFVLDVVVLRLAFPGAAAAAALGATARGWGLFNHLDLPSWIVLPLVLILLDLAIWTQHLATHKVPMLWRLHRVHHADLELDVTSALRFHPFEILLSMVWKIGVVTALGAPAAGVLAYEALLNACALFNHTNIRLPRCLAGLRLVLVTPEMHRVHHSRRHEETDSNYGSWLPWWDWLFRTFRSTPAQGPDGVILGLTEFHDPAELRLDRMLRQPFRAV